MQGSSIMLPFQTRLWSRDSLTRRLQDNQEYLFKEHDQVHLRIVKIYFSLLIYWSGCKLSDDQNICDIKLSCSGVEYIYCLNWNWNCISCTNHPDSLIKTELAIFHSYQFSKNVFWAKLKQELWMLPSQPSSSKGYYECCSKSSDIQRMDRWWRFSKNTSAPCALHCTMRRLSS